HSFTRAGVVTDNQVYRRIRKSLPRSKFFAIIDDGHTVAGECADQCYRLPDVSPTKDKQLKLGPDYLDGQRNATSLLIYYIYEISNAGLFGQCSCGFEHLRAKLFIRDRWVQLPVINAYDLGIA